MDSLIPWLHATTLSWFVNRYFWVWPAAETLHFLALSLLIGVVGLFDLRILGFARGLPLAPLYRMMPLAGAAFIVNLATGILFFAGRPEQYAHNVAFGFKIGFLALAGVNVLVFNLTVLRDTVNVGPGGDAPPLAKIIAAVSLFSWFAVLYFGRMLPYLSD